MNFFSKITTGNRTRGHDFTLQTKYSFAQRTVNEWNQLSADCVYSSSMNRPMFKNIIDHFLVRA